MDAIKEKLATAVNKKNWLFWLGLAGILLIGLSEIFSGGDKEAGNRADPQESCVESTYQEEMEQRLLEIIRQVEGAGEVSVMLTLEGSPETIYAQNEQTQTQVQEDENGSLKRESSSQNEHILFDSGAGKEALVEEQLAPEIKGVAIVCSGGDDIEVIERITELVSVVLDLPSNRICVTKKI